MVSKKIPSTNKIKRIDVESLFGLHSYSIVLPVDGPFSLLIGPNGIGKTTILSMIEFLADPYDADPRPLFETQFRKLKLTYEDGRAILAEKNDDSNALKSILFSFTSNTDSQQIGFSCHCRLGDFLRNRKKGLKKLTQGLLRFFGCYFSVIGDGFGDKYPPMLDGKQKTPIASPWQIGAYLRHHQICHFYHSDHVLDGIFLDHYFERSRFIMSGDLSDSSFIPRFCYDHFPSDRFGNIKSNLLQEQIKSAILLFYKEYMEYFQRYYLKSEQWPAFLYTRENYQIIKSIMGYGEPIASSQKFPHLFDWSPKKRPLSNFRCFKHVYGNSNNESNKFIDAIRFNNLLLAMESLAIALRNLKENVEEMGLGRLKKRLCFEENGSFVLKSFDGRSFGFDKLSTGEKNYLVLLTDILLEASANVNLMEESALYFIDEPEISMHIEMQKDFSRKMRDICKQTGCQIICATHSPFLADGDERLFADFQYHFPKD
jgi:predicted ATP-binding protein involved in virulence